MYRDAETLSYELMGEAHYAEIEREREEQEAREREEEREARGEVQDESDLALTDEEIDALEARLHAMEIRDYGRPITTIERHTARIRKIRAEMAAELAELDARTDVYEEEAA